MVDIDDMEDIFYEILIKYPLSITQARLIAMKLIKEVEDFVEGQQTIRCNNCRGKKFRFRKEIWEAL